MEFIIQLLKNKLGTCYTGSYYYGTYYIVFKNYELIKYTYYTKNLNDELNTQDLIILKLIFCSQKMFINKI